MTNSTPLQLSRVCLLALRSAAFVLLLAVVAPAQIRLHDPANEELAKKTRDAFTEFSSADDNVFETMITNTLAIKAATLEQLYALNRQSQQATINVIPVKTWQQLLENVDQTQQDFLDAYNAARIIIQPDLLGQELPDMKTAHDAAKARAKALGDDKAKKAAELDAEVPKLKDLKKSLDGVRDAVAASSKPIKKLSDLAAFQNLKTALAGMREAKDWMEALEKASNAPGLQMLILDLGVRHQQFRVERLKLDLEKAEARKEIADRIERRLDTVWGDASFDTFGSKKRAKGGLFGQVYANIRPCPKGETCPFTEQCTKGALCSEPLLTEQMLSQQVLETVGILATAAEGEVGKPLKATQHLRNLLDILSRYVSLVGYHRYLLLADAIEAGVNEHLFSIRQSALNTRNREMLVGHGLEGLATYHAGGLKPEEIANFFRATQSIAIGVIAGRGR